MELTEKQCSDIKLSFQTYWNGDDGSDRYMLDEQTSLTIIHTEEDAVEFVLSTSDVTRFGLNTAKLVPTQLRDINEFKPLCDQIDSLVANSISTELVPVKFYHEKSVQFPMSQYVGKVPLHQTYKTA